jgi:hypothetical protein
MRFMRFFYLKILARQRARASDKVWLDAVAEARVVWSQRKSSADPLPRPDLALAYAAKFAGSNWTPPGPSNSLQK